MGAMAHKLSILRTMASTTLGIVCLGLLFSGAHLPGSTSAFVPNGTHGHVMSKVTSTSATIPIKTSSQNGLADQNSEVVQPCAANLVACNLGPGVISFPTYGNDSVSKLQDCTFAAVADWEQIALGSAPSESKIETEYSKSVGGSLGLSNDQVFEYWMANGIGGSYLSHTNLINPDSQSVMNAINDPSVKALIVQLHFTVGQSFAGRQMPTDSYHWVVVDGYTPTGPVVVTWGQTLQMTWQQWNLEELYAWGISVK